MSSVQLVRQGIDSEVLLITGVTRSGKALVAPIVSSFLNIGRVNVDFFMEQIPLLCKNALIEKDVAIYLMKTWLNLRLYEEHLGRSLNFRKEDFTSVYKYKEPEEYLRRLEIPERGDAISTIEQEGKIFLLMTHYTMQNADIWLEAINKLKIIDVIRNPVEIVKSWKERGYGAEFYTDKRSMTPSFKYKNYVLPHHASGWEEQYLNMSTTDRIIEMLYRMQEESTFEYNRISAVFPKKVYRFYYESLFKDHNRAVEKLASITGKHITESTSEILRRERVPRNYEEIKINQRLNLNSIMRDASLSMQRKLIEMVEKYKKELKENE